MPLLDQFLKVIVDQGGSDLHIGEGQPPKMRKHGDIAPIRETPLTHDETMSMLSVFSSREKRLYVFPALKHGANEKPANSRSQSDNSTLKIPHCIFETLYLVIGKHFSLCCCPVSIRNRQSPIRN